MDIDYENSTTYWWILWDLARMRGDRADMKRAQKELRRLGVNVALVRPQPRELRA